MPLSDDSDPRTKFGGSCSFTDTHGPTNLLENSLKPADGLAASLPCINNAIPSEIVLKMFAFLDVNEQIKCRRVCRAWNDLLKLSRRAEIDLAKYDNDYQLALAVHKVITGSTQVLVLTGGHPDATGNFSPFRVIIEMLTAKSIRVPVLVISHCTIWADDLLDCSDPCQVKFRAEWAHVCGTLVLEQTTARVVFDAQGERYCRGVADVEERSRRWDQHMKNGYGVELAIIKGVVMIWEEVKVEAVLNILEEPCGKLEYVPDAMRFVKDHLAQICQEGSPMWRDRVFKMLQKWQPGDSRFYSAAGWSQDHLACIPVESLRTLTVLALRYQLGERLRDLDDDDSAHGNSAGQAADFYYYPEDYDEYE